MLCARGLLLFLLGAERRLFLGLAPCLGGLLLLLNVRLLLFLGGTELFGLFLGFEPLTPLRARLGAGRLFRAVRREIIVPVCQITDLTGLLVKKSCVVWCLLVHLLLIKLGEKLLLALGQTDLVCRTVGVLHPRGAVYAAAGLSLKHDADKRV